MEKFCYDCGNFKPAAGFDSRADAMQFGACHAGPGILNLVTGRFEWPQATTERNHEVDRFHPCGEEGALWTAKPAARL